MHVVNRVNARIRWRAYLDGDTDKRLTWHGPDGQGKDGQGVLNPGGDLDYGFGQDSITLVLTEDSTGKDLGTYPKLSNRGDFLITQAHEYIDVVNWGTVQANAKSYCDKASSGRDITGLWTRVKKLLVDSTANQQRAVVSGLDWATDPLIPDEYSAFVAWAADALMPDASWYTDIKAVMQDCVGFLDRMLPALPLEKRQSLKVGMAYAESLLDRLQALRRLTSAPQHGTFRLLVEGKQPVMGLVDSLQRASSGPLALALSKLEADPSFLSRVAFGYAAMAIIQTNFEIIQVLSADVRGSQADIDNFDMVRARIEQRATTIKAIAGNFSAYVKDCIKSYGIPSDCDEGLRLASMLTAAEYPASIEALGGAGAESVASAMQVLATELKTKIPVSAGVSVPGTRIVNPDYSKLEVDFSNQDRTQYDPNFRNVDVDLMLPKVTLAGRPYLPAKQE